MTGRGPGSPRILILSAAIGEGHDLPARVLAADIRAEAADAEVEIFDALELLHPWLRWMALRTARSEGVLGTLAFDLNHCLITRVAPTRALTGLLIRAAAVKRLRALLAARRPGVIVATYPGASEVLGRLRAARTITTPVASAITDLASLHYWAHPGIDLHMITHPESAVEVRGIAPGARVEAVRGLNLPDFLEPRDRASARARLELPAVATVVVISGGGWAVGDLAGAADAALAIEGAVAVVLTGRNDEARIRLQSRYVGNARVRVLGFTEAMADVLAAADALVHSSAGLTVLEAHCVGCPVISYGWGRGHIRANNRAFERFGLARVATDRAALDAALRCAIAEGGMPDQSFASLPLAAGLVLALGDYQAANGS